MADSKLATAAGLVPDVIMPPRPKYTRYLAYGSDMRVAYMARTCPNSRYIGRAVLTDYRWHINALGFANLAKFKTAHAPGLVFEIDEVDKARLQGRRFPLYEDVLVEAELYPAPYCLSQRPATWIVDHGGPEAVLNEATKTGSGNDVRSAYKERDILVFMSPSVVTDGRPDAPYAEGLNLAAADAMALGIDAVFFEKVVQQFMPGRTLPYLRVVRSQGKKVMTTDNTTEKEGTGKAIDTGKGVAVPIRNKVNGIPSVVVDKAPENDRDSGADDEGKNGKIKKKVHSTPYRLRRKGFFGNLLVTRKASGGEPMSRGISNTSNTSNTSDSNVSNISNNSNSSSVSANNHTNTSGNSDGAVSGNNVYVHSSATETGRSQSEEKLILPLALPLSSEDGRGGSTHPPGSSSATNRHRQSKSESNVPRIEATTVATTPTAATTSAPPAIPSAAAALVSAAAKLLRAPAEQEAPIPSSEGKIALVKIAEPPGYSEKARDNEIVLSIGPDSEDEVDAQSNEYNETTTPLRPPPQPPSNPAKPAKPLTMQPSEKPRWRARPSHIIGQALAKSCTTALPPTSASMPDSHRPGSTGILPADMEARLEEMELNMRKALFLEPHDARTTARPQNARQKVPAAIPPTKAERRWPATPLLHIRRERRGEHGDMDMPAPPRKRPASICGSGRQLSRLDRFLLQAADHPHFYNKPWVGSFHRAAARASPLHHRLKQRQHSYQQHQHHQQFRRHGALAAMGYSSQQRRMSF